MEEASKRLSTPLIIAGAGAVLLAGGFGWLWVERTPIAASFIDDALRAKGVPASYELTDIGFRRHRIEHIRIGDPARPDLVADWAEVELAIGWSGPYVRAIDGAGVQLRGRLVDGRLSLGTIDRLLPKEKPDQPFVPPSIYLTARAMRFDVEAPQGRIAARLDGAGDLDGGFRGTLAISSDRLAQGGCTITAPKALIDVRIDSGKPILVGPAQASRLDCPDVRLTAPSIVLSARGSADLTRWDGQASLQRGALAASGVTVAGLGGKLLFRTSPERIDGSAVLQARTIRQASVQARQLSLDARYRFDPRSGNARVEGVARVAGGRLDDLLGERIAGQLASAESTPIGPVLAEWGRAIRGAGRSIEGLAAFMVAHGGQGGALRIDRLEAHAPNGARLLARSDGAGGFGWRWPQGGAVVNGSVEMAGGGLPQMLLSLRQAIPGAPLSGSATIAPYRAGDASLTLAPLRFGPGPGGRTIVTTRATMDGPLADGRVEGLDIPLHLSFGGRGGLLLNPTCVPLGFRRIAIAGTVIGQGSLPLCPVDGALLRTTPGGAYGGGARIAGPRLRGRVGDQPLILEARKLTASVARPGFAVDGLAVRLGDPKQPTRLDIAALDGRMGREGFGGTFADASGKLAAVPLLLSEGAGGWTLRGSKLSLEAGLRFADAETLSPRFHPLITDDVRLTLLGGKIDATATLREPRSNAAVSRVAVRHDLSSGRGDARLDIDDLRFGQRLQPEAITPLTLGIVANVVGSVRGQGRIRWSDGNVTSDGDFATDKLDFAAAFGPVNGLKGKIHFTDLLGMVSSPDQEVTIAEINPGIAVTDGVIHYRLLADQKLAVTDGRWPFAGGTLTLEPSVLDMGQPVARRLTFRINGLDAATFVQQLDFKNISVTGRFDGVLPIVFDAQGGRIENGELQVRPGGGTLSYVGDVTNANLGRVARIAFDALKSMRYEKLTIELNGSLDGEIISKVRFDGTNDKPEETAKQGGIVGRLLAPVTRLPFRFNITITAPFRGLVNSAQTFVDPSIVLRNTAGAVAQPVVSPSNSIQPQ